MNSSSPKIGFDRFIKLEWAATALQVRADISTQDDLREMMESSIVGNEARRKTLTVLKRLWLDPHPELVEFADRGVQIYRNTQNASVFALTWGMALATYPFFGKVAEIVGRLTALHGDCTASEVHRRMAEIYGEREGTRRMARMVLQSQADWGAIERTEKGKRIVRKKALDLDGSMTATWLAEACLRYAERSLPIVGIESNPAIYPFVLGGSTSYFLSKSQALELRVDSAGSQIISLAH